MKVISYIQDGTYTISVLAKEFKEKFNSGELSLDGVADLLKLQGQQFTIHSSASKEEIEQEIQTRLNEV